MPKVYPHLIVDYGHGGLIDGVYQTPGKRFVFTFSTSPVVFFEGVQNRVIAAGIINDQLSLGRKVYDCTAGVWRTQPVKWWDLEQEDVSLSTRVRHANQPSTRTGLGISIHSNAMGMVHQGTGTEATGWELFTSPGETQSDRAASHMGRQLQARGVKVRADYTDGDIDKEALFAVVKQTDGAFVLVEHGFHSTWEEARRMLNHPEKIVADYVHALEGLIK
jgi:N-acetylmuramoyl-L-alanine amidase